ncbi:MAG: sulfite oxidase heme-binding subunit YedZ [Bosea sp. (in: a-proteobacteria)]
MYPWTDRAGRFSGLKSVVLAACCVPMLLLVAKAFGGMLGSKPLTYAIHDTGDWAVRFLLISLLVTPLRSIANWPKLIIVRRLLGLTALAYVLVHFSLYVVEQRYDAVKVVSEIVLRIYLTIGFVAILGLVALGVTSTDGMIRRLGSVRWNRLHAMIYAIAVLALLHFFLQSKVDVTQPVLMTGLFAWLMGYRTLKKRGFAIGVGMLVALAVAAGLATALVEAGWYAARTGVMASRVLEANLDFSFNIRPAWWVLWAALTMPLILLWRGRGQTARRGNASGAGSEIPVAASSPSQHPA